MPVQRRVAFDLGSGATKMAIADVDTVTNRVVAMHFAQEREVLLGESMRLSPQRAVQADTVALLFRTLAELSALAEKIAPGAPRVGIATAVYREAGNGPELLTELLDRYAIHVQILPQEEEAMLGFRTGVSMRTALGEPAPARGLVVWDSGGASFQITTEGRTGLRCVNGQWGSSKAVVAQRVALGLPGDAATVNPVAAPQFDKFVAELQATIEEQTQADAAWVRRALVADGKELVCIGGQTNAFRCACLLVGRTRDVTRADVIAAAHGICGLSDDDVARRALTDRMAQADRAALILGDGPTQIPQPNMATAKLALVAAVMGALHLPAFRFFETVGVTPGLFATPAMWTPRSKM